MEITLSIGAVERETGLSKDTLRVWERRYGFPQPARDSSGERLYPLAQVERLRVIKRLLDHGHRPSKIIGFGDEQLRLLSDEVGLGAARTAPEEESKDLLQYIALCKAYQFDELRRALSQELLRLGLYRFVVDVVAPLNAMVGARWANGTFAIFEEHLYTESVQIVMRNAIASIPQYQGQVDMRPRILLTTFPQEQHSLGLLMAEAIFALEGARCISLGVQTPVMDIAQAANAQHVDIVALSFSGAMNGNHLLEGVRDLRAELAPNMEIWAGGACAVLHRRPPSEVKVLGLTNIGERIAEWRRLHLSSSRAA